MVPADKTTMSSSGPLLPSFCFFKSSVKFDVNDIFIYFYIRTRFAEIYWYNNNNFPLDFVPLRKDWALVKAGT